MKNIFICHRPYHILRSGSIIYKSFSGNNNHNILITYNLINHNTNQFQTAESSPVLEKAFTEIIRISRSDDVSIWNYNAFKEYYKNKVEECRSLVEKLCDFDNLYFFSDLEKPIEILVGMLKEKKKGTAEIILVDEGIAAYYHARPYWQTVLKQIVVKTGGYKYINHTANYGRSHLYTSALATFPEKCVFREVPIETMLPLDNEYLNEVVRTVNLQVDVRGKFVLYLSTILDIEFGIPQSDELGILRQIKESANKNGYQFFIKPHPVQDKNYYTSDPSLSPYVVNTQLPAEVFFAQGAVIISVASSSLINAKMQGVRSVELSNIFGIKHELPSFDIYTPSTIEEFDNFIKD